MKFAVIAAGEGSRLRGEGEALPKPLVKIDGEAMIDRLLRIFSSSGSEENVVIVNNITPLVKEHILANYNVIEGDGIVKTCKAPLCGETPVRLACKTTKSSMHSFYEISDYLKDGKFCLTTVDTIFKENEFKEYINAFNSFDGDGLMGVTSYVDDEKPLWVATDKELNIHGFDDDRGENDKYISGGLYCLSPKALDVLAQCVRQGVSRMRNFQRSLVSAGMRLKAFPFTKIIDVDHLGDIEKAKQLVEGK